MTRIRITAWVVAGACLVASPLAAQESLRFGADLYTAGETLVIADPGLDDVFAAGNRLRIDADLAGTAHLLGRQITLTGRVDSLYAAGMEVLIQGTVAGDATVTGYRLAIGAVGGDLRASGAGITLSGLVGGSALLAGDEVQIDGTITGDLSVAASELTFGPLARVGGQLVLYGDEADTLAVPASVAPADRIERRQSERVEGASPSWQRRTFAEVVGSFLIAVLVVSLLAAALAAILPARVAALRQIVLEHPLRSLWIGALTQSALTGAVVVAGLTLIGLLAAPAFLLAAALLGFFGYVIGTYAFGVALLSRAGRPLPDSFGDRALAAFAGALAAGVLALIPFLGWLFVLALALGGVGAIMIAWLNPRFGRAA